MALTKAVRESALGVVLRAALLAAVVILSGLPARAVVLTWDADGSTSGPQDGSGTWTTGSGGWWNGTSGTTWVTNDQAVFGAGTDGTYTITLGGNVTAATGNTTNGSLNFLNSGYTLSAASARTVNIGNDSTTAIIKVASGKTATIGSNVTVQRSVGTGQVGIVGGGTLKIDAGGTLRNTNANNNEVANGSTLWVNGGSASFTNSIIFGPLTTGYGASGSLLVDSGTFSITGAGNLIVGRATGDVSTATINGGAITTSTGALNFGNTSITATSTFHLNGGTVTTRKINYLGGTATFNFNGGTLKVQTSGSSAFLGGLTRANVRNGGAVFDTNGQSITVSQALLHSNVGGDNAVDGGLTLNDTAVTKGKLTLSGVNTYTGPTTVRSGTLALGAAGSIADSQTITIGDAGSSGAVLDLTAKAGTFTFGAGQTVKGIGTTNIGDGKTVAVAGVWAPGNSIGSNAVTGNLTLSGTSQFELGTPGTSLTSPGTSDFTAVSGTLTLGGDLALLDNANAGGLGSYGAGAYRLFTAPTVSGSFVSVTAPTGATSTRVGMVYSSGTASGEGVFANVYNLAAASAAQTVNVGTMLAGSTKTAAVSLTNSAPANATYTETLSTAGFSSTSPGFTASGSLSGLAGGASGTGTLLVGLGSGLTAGVATGSTSLALVSNAVNSSGLADLSVGSQTITITGTVLDAATAQFSGVSSGTNWSLDLGQFLQGSGTSAPTLFDVTNVLQAVGFTADLSLITFTPTLDSGVISTNLNLGSFATLQAGGTNQFSAVMALDTVGSFTNVYQLAFDSTSGGVSLGGGPQEVTLTVTGAVVPEPHGLVLACCGVALAGWAMRRRCHF